MYSQFKNVGIGQVFSCNETIYTKINRRMGQITMPDKPYHDKKFYFGYNELCKIIK